MDLKLKNNSKLSIPYIEIEYLESTGTQWIDTGINISPTMGVFVDFQLSELPSDHQALFGYIDDRSSTSVDKDYCFYKDSNTGKYLISCSPNSTTNTEISADTNRHTLHFNITNRVILVDNGNTYSITLSKAPTNTADKTCPIFGRKYTNASNVLSWAIGAYIRIYKFQIYNNGSLFRNFIPVLDNRGIPCMYETKSNTFFYNAGTGDFIVPFNIFKNITTAYIENCPNINTINLLRGCPNLTNVRCDIGSVSGTLAELQHYATLHGFSRFLEEPDNTTAPVINGTFTITDWYTNEELQALQGIITGLTIVTDSSKNIDTALINGDFAIQTLDSTQPNYNPAVCIILEDAGYGITHYVNGDKKWFLTKTDASSITSIGTLFRYKTNVTDSNGIVSDDTSTQYKFSTFNEFEYFTGITTIPIIETYSGAFASCVYLTSIKLPSRLTSIGDAAFFGCNNLNTVYIPKTLTSVGGDAFMGTEHMNGGNVYYEGTIKQWLDISFNNRDHGRPVNPCSYGAHFYVNNNEEVTNLVIPDTVTTIKPKAFMGMKFIQTVEISSSVTTIQSASFRQCIGLTDLVIPFNVTSFDPLALTQAGNNTGTLTVFPSIGGSDQNINFKNIITHSSYGTTYSGSGYAGDIIVSIRAKEVFYQISGNRRAKNIRFLEASSIPYTIAYNSSYHTPNAINILLRNNDIAATPSNVSAGSMNKIYVGNGSSRSNDETVLAKYIADTDWNNYSSKLSTWYDYNGEYKWYYVTDNLTNCINTNPDEWPHITREESYQTTIVPDEGMTLDSVTVEMYEAIDDGLTPNIPTDITSQVYNSSTGEINIPSVTGNVIITANAS